jgi:hypothetical protein
MEHFLINSSICLFVLWLAYKLLLENSSWHELKRWYLLSALILSLSIPFIVVETVIVPIQEIPFVNVHDNNFTTATPAIQQVTQEPEFKINWFYIGLTFYLFGVVVMLWRFGRNLYAFRIGKEDIVSFYKTYQLVLRNQFTIPHSFMKRIFVSREDYETNQIPEVILEHEKAHLDQKHSIDILFIELMLIVFWFNPLLYVIKYSIKLNHEFLADRTVLNQGVSASVYQKLILKQATTGYQKTLANTFTFPIIKKRFHIMKTKSSKTSLLLRSLVIIPMIAFLIVSCGKEEKKYEIQESDNRQDITYEIENVAFKETQNITNSETKDVVYAAPGEEITPEIYYTGVKFLKYENSIQYNDTTIGDLVINKLYEDLTETDKEKLGDFSLSYVPKPHIIRIPSESDMEEYLNDKVFRIWIDGEEVDNSKLKNYSISDFKSHSGRMFVTKTGRKVHPQAFNVMFYTSDYFEAKNMDKQMKFYPGKEIVSHKIKKRIREDYDPISYAKWKQDSVEGYDKKQTVSSASSNPSKKQTPQKNVILNSPIITTDALNKTKDAASNSNFYAEVANEPDTEDFKMRKMILIASLSQNKPIAYQLNGKKSTVTTIQEYLVNNETADVSFIEGNQNELQFSKNNGAPMNKEELQKVYSKIFKYRPKEEPTTFVAINETSWKVVTVDATVSKGSFERKGANYTYDSSDLNNIKVFDKQGKLLNKQEFENLAVGFSVIWWKGEQKYKELLQQPEIIEGLKKGTYAVFYKVDNKSEYTKDYQEALKIDASNSFLRMGSTLESTTINLTPHSWAYTNPSLTMFQKYLTE